MEHYKIFKYVIVSKSIRFKTLMLRSDLCDHSDAYIAVKGIIYLLAADTNKKDKLVKNFACKNNAPFRSCISRINNTLIDSAEDLDIVMTMYSLSEYSQNYSMTPESLWNYYRDAVDNINNNAADGKSFKYKTKIVRRTPQRPIPGNPGDPN